MLGRAECGRHGAAHHSCLAGREPGLCVGDRGRVHGPAVDLTRAAALFGAGQHAAGRQLVEQVLASEPGHLAAQFYAAQMALHAGDGARARSLLLALLERFPDFPGAAGMLAGLRFPGPTYRDVLQRLHELRKPRHYLEIGVETGATLALAKGSQRAIGIDPDGVKLRPDLVPPQARVYQETSDAFFGRISRQQAFGDRGVDMAFIDGMHLFEYALRDFINVESWSEPDGVIVLHDCVPLLPLTASRERRSKFWVGDVWKLVSILREYRPELRVRIIATAPSGLCVVRGLNPRSDVLAEHLSEIIARYKALPYPTRGLEVPDGFELLPASAAGLAQALA